MKIIVIYDSILAPDKYTVYQQTGKWQLVKGKGKNCWGLGFLKLVIKKISIGVFDF